MGTSHQRVGISASALKYFAIICMAADHIAEASIPEATALYIVLRSFGRFTAPIMCFFVAEGFYKTHSVKKYAFRLGIFALISTPPFCLMTFAVTGEFSLTPLNVVYTLLLGLLSLWVMRSDLSNAVKPLFVVAAAALSLLGDWEIFGVLYVLIFGLFRAPDTQPRNLQIQGEYPLQSCKGSFAKSVALPFSLVTLLMVFTYSGLNLNYILINSAAFLTPIFLYFYNGRRGGEWAPRFNKWLFYIFYPVHIAVIAAIKLCI